MKKILKNTLAITLVLIFVFSCTSAFAAELGETLKWTFKNTISPTDYDVEYSYGGELEVGETTVSAPDGDDHFYYVFNAENDGYYMLSFSGEHGNRYFKVAEEITENGVKYEKEFAYVSSDSDLFIINELYFFEAGETVVIGFEEHNKVTSIQNAYFEIEYYGDAVSLDYDKSVFNEMVSGEDYYYAEETKDKQITVHEVDVTVNFSEGQSILFERQTLTAEYINPAVEGANKLKFEFFGIKEEVDATLYSIKHYISNVEIVDEKDLTLFLGENGRPNYATIPAVELKITYSDGTTEIFDTENGAHITLSNGREYYIYVRYLNNEAGEYRLHISIADEIYQEYPCTVREKTFADTLAALPEYISQLFNDFFERIIMIFSSIFN